MDWGQPFGKVLGNSTYTLAKDNRMLGRKCMYVTFGKVFTMHVPIDLLF